MAKVAPKRVNVRAHTRPGRPIAVKAHSRQMPMIPLPPAPLPPPSVRSEGGFTPGYRPERYLVNQRGRPSGPLNPNASI